MKHLLCGDRRWMCLRIFGTESETEQILNQVALFRRREAEGHARVVMVDNLVQGRESTVVIEAALQVSEEHADGRRAVPQIRRSIRLKAVDADFGRHMQIPAGIGPERLDVAVIALGLAAEELVSTRCGSRVKTASGRLWRRQRELI